MGKNKERIKSSKFLKIHIFIQSNLDKCDEVNTIKGIFLSILIRKKTAKVLEAISIENNMLTSLI